MFFVKMPRRLLKMAFLVVACSILAVSPAFADSVKDAKLGDLSIYVTGGVKLSPPFSSEQTQYNVYVNSDIGNVVIKATVASPEGRLKINDGEVASGADYAAKLITGENKFEIRVTGFHGASQKYTLYITRENIQPVADKFLKAMYTDPETGATMPYRLFVPENYDPAKAYPLVLFLHGGGERGSDNEAQVMANQGATVWAKPEAQAKHPCFVLAPQARNTWDGGFTVTRGEDNKVSLGRVLDVSTDLDMAEKVLEKVIATYNIDKNRIYATGVSQGGFGVWNLNEKYPDLFAAMVPICGGGDPAQAYKLKNKPIWAFHAEGDPIIPVSYTRNMVSALRALGSSPLYTEYPKETYIFPVAHFSWVLAYQTTEMRDWLFAQVKK